MLTADRVDFMEQTPNIGWRFHLRINCTLAVLLLVDAAMVYLAIASFTAHGPSMMLLFGFEVFASRVP